jgi:hypothetical protein
MRVPQGVLLASADVGREDFRRIEPLGGGGVFPLADGIVHWHIVPREGRPLSLVLPFPGSSGVTVARFRQLAAGKDALVQEGRAAMMTQAAHEARLVLSGGMLMSYLTTWALWADECDATGKFLVTSAKVAELRGFLLRRRGTTTSYGKHMSVFRRDLDALTNCGVTPASETRPKSVEPMLQPCDIVKGGKYYRHASLLIDTITTRMGDASGFAQVPLRAVRLSAHDARAVVGLAALWRTTAASTIWSGTLEELALELGVYREAHRRSAGRAYWKDLADHLTRVVTDGGFGTVWFQGSDPSTKTRVVMTPSDELVSAYQRLREARERARAKADAAKHEASVRRLLPPAQRRRAR